MSEQIESQVTSRRKLFLLLGLAAGFAVPATVLMASSAEAQQPPKKKMKKKKKGAPTEAAPSSETPKAQ
jgi:hypothetical protein